MKMAVHPFRALQNRIFQKPPPVESEKTDKDILFNELRKKEYARLDKLGHVYLDFTGGNIYPQSLIDLHHEFLQKAVYGNPHSTNPASGLSEKYIGAARKTVLDYFNAPGYDCIFTQNASGALQIVGESYPFSPAAHLLLTADNHNSVNGIREYARTKGAGFSYSSMNCEDLSLDDSDLEKHLDAHPDKMEKLFAFPAQSNVSGVRHSLSWIKKAQDKGWDVLLDAAAFVPTSKLDLSATCPDFVSVSFYKIFGYPTGIGCLLIKKSTFSKLKKPSFAGGTITLSAVTYSSYFLKQDHEKFENGTVNYLDIPAITNGLEFISCIGIENINARIKELGLFIIQELTSLRHDNGLAVIKLYGPADMENRGGTFLMNFMDIHGRFYPLQYIEQMANAGMISFRTGCFCNPGIDELNHSISSGHLKSYFDSRHHGDYFDFINFLGRMRGAVRISIGIPTTRSDLQKFVQFVKQFLNGTIPEHSITTPQQLS
jgi:molybdenum cofactor sulfurtransferase